MGPQFGRDITEIAMAFISVGLVALLVSHSKGATNIINASTAGFGGLLDIVTLQGGGMRGSGMSNVFGGNASSFSV